MTAKAVTCLWSKRAKPKRPIRNVTVYSIATRRWKAHSSSATTASTESTYLEALQLSPSTAVHHHHRRRRRLHQWYHYRFLIGLINLKKQKTKTIDSILNLRNRTLMKSIQGKGKENGVSNFGDEGFEEKWNLSTYED